MINEKQKWPSDKRRYDGNYLRMFGMVCPDCGGNGYHEEMNGEKCKRCYGLGYVEKPKRSKHLKMRKEHFEGKADYS